MSDGFPSSQALLLSKGKPRGEVMKKRVFLPFFALVLFVVLGAVPALAVTVFGPEQYVRTSGNPDRFVATFDALPGEGSVFIVNGDDSGGCRVTSGQIFLNGQSVADPSDFKRKVGIWEVPVVLERHNSLTVELSSKPFTFLTIRVFQDHNFERYPAWDRPDPAITGLTLSPERADPGVPVTVTATVANLGTGAVHSPTLVLLVDGVELLRTPVSELAPGQERRYAAVWTAAGPGNHQVDAHFDGPPGEWDESAANNARTATARVSGETNPEPALEFGEIDLGALDLAPGASIDLPVTVRNPSFAPIQNLPVRFLIDGALLPPSVMCWWFPGPGFPIDVWPPDIGPWANACLDIPSGGEQTLVIPWEDIVPGEHVLTVQLLAPDTYPVDFKKSFSWHAIALDKGVLYTQPGLDKWASMGPRVITGDTPGDPVGRIDQIAFHPWNNKTLYVAAPRGGIWKTADGGSSWTPLGDKWPKMNMGAVATDPKAPDTVYAATGSAMFKGGDGFYKSNNGGQTWFKFASKSVAEGASRLIVTYAKTGEVLIYAASDRGILRYKSSDPLALSSSLSEWDLILPGLPNDLVVSPADPEVLFASLVAWEYSNKYDKDFLVHKGLYRTTSASTVTPSQWEPITSGLPPLSTPTDAAQKPGHLKLDFFRSDPKWLYAAIVQPLGNDIEFPAFLGIYRSGNGGTSWDWLWYEYSSNDFNAFIRVDPQVHHVYWGGVKLYSRATPVGGPLGPIRKVTGVHDDAKDLQFWPGPSGSYLATNDGGIWQCTKGEFSASDSCVDWNENLRTTMFYDIDPSPTDPNVMIGGTQDNMTILSQASGDWRVIQFDGDGFYSLIAPSKPQVMYAQYQSLDTTKRTENGGIKWVGASEGLPKDFPGDSANIKVNYQNADRLISGGDQVYMTGDGHNWSKAGPAGTSIKTPGASLEGWVSRVEFGQPGETDWIAGTQLGQVWFTNDSGGSWYLLFKHPKSSFVNSLAVIAPGAFYAVFSSNNDPQGRDVYLFERWPTVEVKWTATRITANLPTQSRRLQVVSGDGTESYVAFVGTDAGVWKGMEIADVWSWVPYNDGLPLAEITDLVVDPTSKELRAATYGRGAWRVNTGVVP